VELFRAAGGLVVRSMVLSTQAAGEQRLLRLGGAAMAGEQAGELARLRDGNRRLVSENRCLRRELLPAQAPAERVSESSGTMDGGVWGTRP
jgi:hypothetical protein